MMSKFALAVLAAVAGTSTASITDNPFQLYAYSPNINGYPLININNTLYISSLNASQIDSAYNVTFTKKSSTLPATSNGSSTVLAAPQSASGSLTLSKGTNSSLSTSAWSFFDGTLAMKGSDHLQSLFSAEATDDVDVFRVGWNVSGGGEPLALRLFAPAGPDRS